MLSFPVFVHTVYPELRGEPRKTNLYLRRAARCLRTSLSASPMLSAFSHSPYILASLLPYLVSDHLCAASNSSRIRTSKTPLPQALYNLHLQDPLGSADSKRLTAPRFRPQPLYSPHLRDPVGSAGNTGVITPVESALTEFASANPLESALTENRGEGGVMVNQTRFRPSEPFVGLTFSLCLFSPSRAPGRARAAAGAGSAWRYSGKSARRASRCTAPAPRCLHSRKGPPHSYESPAEIL